MMHRKIKPSVFIAAISFLLLFVNSSSAIEPGELSHKIAYLKGGEVWISDLEGQRREQITSDSGRVDDFLFSPSLEYLAYASIIKYVDEPGLWDDTDKVPQRAVCSIVIMDLRTQRVMKKIMPTADPWIYMLKWLPGNKLLYYSSSGFDVSGFYTYDLGNDSSKELDYNEGNAASDIDYSDDGSMKAYVDYSGIGKKFTENLHVVNLKTKLDRVVASRRSINCQEISHDNGRIAFIEVESIDRKYFDNLWVYNIKDNSLDSLYKGPASPKAGGVNGIYWSLDDRYIGMFFSPEATVVDSKMPSEIYRIPGANFNWIDNDRIVFAQGDDTYIYNLITRKSGGLIEGAAKPRFLREKAY